MPHTDPCYNKILIVLGTKKSPKNEVGMPVVSLLFDCCCKSLVGRKPRTLLPSAEREP